MDKYREKDAIHPVLLDLNVGDREWEEFEEQRTEKGSEEKKLELRLAPPGGEEHWMMKMKMKNSSREDSILSLGCFSNRASLKAEENGWFMNSGNGGQTHNFSPFSSSPSQRLPPTSVGKESSQTCNTEVGVDLHCVSAAEMMKNNKASFSSTAVPNSSQKRTAPASVVGWPPIRSFRKNLASTSSSSKPANESPDSKPSKPPTKEPTSTPQKGLFVKINMDGIPIGRKVDLKSYNTYDKLSGAVDELFRGLLAAQRDSSSGEGHGAITGLLDGSGEYTLVYEDNEGDRMLVGDVPWHMFVSTVKRLRVLRSSELSKLCSGSRRTGKTSVAESR